MIAVFLLKKMKTPTHEGEQIYGVVPQRKRGNCIIMNLKTS